MPNPINLTGPFYSASKAANPGFSADTFSCAEETVAALLGTATTSDHPGMLLGKVQSGKTCTFISALANAFDNGFDIAMVLSKNSRALIEETAKCLNSEFSMFTEDGAFESVAVASKAAPVPPSDPDDEIFLLCAIDGRADFLVSEDHALIALKSKYTTPIIGTSSELGDSLGA